MQATSELYKSILADPAHTKELRAFVDGVQIGHRNIIISADAPRRSFQQLPTVTGSLFAKSIPAVGGCIARQLDIMILPEGAVPRMAEIRLETRLVLRQPLTGELEQASEWLPQGTFYIDTRKSIAGLGLLHLHCYDAMLKAEQIYLQEGDTGEWPRPMPDVVADIAARMGVSVDPRTVIDPAYTVGYPNDLTMREILGYIAAAHAGNFIITDAGALRLVPLYNPAVNNDPGSSYLVTEDGQPIVIGGVMILV